VERGERVLGVATWGDPRLWRYAEYVAGGKRVEAFSTLSILREVENPVKIVVVVLDTLAAAESEGKSYDDIIKLRRRREAREMLREPVPVRG
jgi:CRISPR/Cas system-associated protein Csx1